MHNATIVEAFHRYASGDRLTTHGVKCVVTTVTGARPAKAALQRLLGPEAFAEGTANGFTLAAVRAVVEGLGTAQEPDGRLRQVFESFDVRGVGYISKPDARTVFSAAASAVPGRVVDEVFDEVDRDRSGRVSCREFMGMMRHQHHHNGAITVPGQAGGG